MKVNQKKAGVLLTYLAQGIHIVSGLLYTPIMLRLLGQSEYGLYQLVASVVSYLSVLSLGFNSSYMRFYTMVKKEGEMTTEEIEKQILKQLRMNGLVNSDLEVIHHLDREIQKESDVIPVAIKDGYVQEAKSSVAGQKRFDVLRHYVGGRLKRSGQSILNGENGLLPYKDGDRTACDYCPYHAVCGFDTKTAGYGFKRLRSMKPEEVWQEIEDNCCMKTDKNKKGDE